MASPILDKIKERDSKFKLYKRKHIGYKFLNFRRGSTNLNDIKCTKPPSYFIISSQSDDDGDVIEECKNYCGRVVVCHATGEKSIHSAKDFFQKYTVAESSNTAYPKRELVRGYMPDRSFLDGLGEDTTFVNFWGREDQITDESVIIRFNPGEYYVKPRAAFKMLYTDDTRDRTQGASENNVTMSTEVVIVSHNDAAEGAPMVAFRLHAGLRSRGYRVRLVALSRSSKSNSIPGFEGGDALFPVSRDAVVILNTVISCRYAEQISKYTGRILGVIHEVYNETFAWVRPEFFEGLDRAVFVSEACRRSYPPGFFRVPCAVIHNWVSDAERRFIDGIARRDEGKILCLGAVGKHKGQLVAAKAVRKLNDMCPEHKRDLVIAGPVYDAGYEREIRNTLGSNVHFLGPLNYASCMTVLRRSSVLVAASPMESFSLVVQEAMYSGVPVVASDVGGIPEQIEHGIHGYLFDAGDENQCAALLRRSLDFGSETVDAARERSLRDFSESEKVKCYTREIRRMRIL